MHCCPKSRRSAASRGAGVAALVGLVWVTSACQPTFAPPPATTHYGAAGRLVPGEGEIAAAASNAGGTLLGAAPLGPGTIELGAEGGRSWALGLVGYRFHLLGKESEETYLAADWAVGVAAGLGGERCGNQDLAPGVTCDGDMVVPDGVDWHRRFAIGGYISPGVALHFDWFVLFFRTTLQVATARAVPPTFWASALFGAEVRVGPVRLYLGLGGGLYTNDSDSNGGGLIELGGSIPFDVSR